VVAILEGSWPEKGDPDAEALAEIAVSLTALFGIAFDASEPPFVHEGRAAGDRNELGRAVLDKVLGFLEEKKKHCDRLAEQYADLGYPRFEQLERDFLLQVLDVQWKDHLHSMDGLRDGINLRGYAQRDPKIEYQREGYALFQEMNDRIDAQALEIVFKVQLRDPAEAPPAASRAPARAPAPALRAASGPGAPPPAAGPLRQPGPAAATARPRSDGERPKVGRNDPCPCGSGRKYKKCCGAG
jgi:preprotein translocase subunit SecA